MLVVVAAYASHPTGHSLPPVLNLTWFEALRRGRLLGPPCSSSMSSTGSRTSFAWSCGETCTRKTPNKDIVESCRVYYLLQMFIKYGCFRFVSGTANHHRLQPKTKQVCELNQPACNITSISLAPNQQIYCHCMGCDFSCGNGSVDQTDDKAHNFASLTCSLASKFYR